MYFLCKSKWNYKYFWWKLENCTYSVGNADTCVFTTYACRGKNTLFNNTLPNILWASSPLCCCDRLLSRRRPDAAPKVPQQFKFRSELYSTSVSKPGTRSLPRGTRGAPKQRVTAERRQTANLLFGQLHLLHLFFSMLVCDAHVAS